MQETYQRIPLDNIVPSPYQYRKSFGGPEDDDLAESVGKHGVLQPIRVRPNGKPGTFELVFGERRLRAAKVAQLDDIPAIVVELGDDQVIEQLLIENLKRRDVHPLEEGEGYQRLLDQHGYTIEQLIAKTGKSKAHLYGRMKLTKLAPGARKAVIEGHLNVAIAELIARIPDTKLQERACKEVLGKDSLSVYDHMNISPEAIGPEAMDSRRDAVPQPLSYRASVALLRRRYATKLALAKFNPHDAALTNAGACTTCPHRSGNQPELPGVVEAKADDLCTNPPCFAEKTKAAWDKTAQIARDSGIAVVDAKEAESEHVFGFDGMKVNETGPYIDLDQPLPYDLQRQPGSKTTWGKLLGKAVSDLPRALVQDDSGAPRELFDRKAAIEVLREAGKIDKPAKPEKASGKPSKKSAPPIITSDQRDLKISALQRLLGELATKIECTAPGKKETAWWRWIANALLDHVLGVGEIPEVFLMRRGVTEFDAHDIKGLEKEIEACRSTNELRSFVIELLVATLDEGVLDNMRQAKERFDDACDLFGVDFDKSIKDAKSAAKIEKEIAESKVKVADAKVPAKKGGKK